MEVGIQFLVLTCIATLVQVAPNGSYGGHKGKLRKGVAQHCQHILPHAEHRHTVQVGQHVVHYCLLLLLREGMQIQLLLLLFEEEVHRNHHDRRVNDHQTISRLHLSLHRLTQVGSHRNTRVQGIRLKHHLAINDCRKRETITTDAYYHALFIIHILTL